MSDDELALTARSGLGVTIAIVDSGVDASHPWLAGASMRHVQIEKQGESAFVAVPSEGGDASGHGTACAGIVHRMVPRAAIVSVRALGPDGRGSRDALVAALRFCVRERFDVVNLSLGIDVPRATPLRPNDHRSIVELYEIADNAYTARVVLVASGPNVATFRTYPGRFKSLIGVGRGDYPDAETLCSDLTQDHEVLAPGTNVTAPALGGGERLWTGTSFACPHVAAHVARIRAAHPGLSVEATKAALHAVAKGQRAALAEAHATA